MDDDYLPMNNSINKNESNNLTCPKGKRDK